jgi:superfamily II DNA helicase RecQ
MKKDVVGCLKTGGGKTLTFWVPLLMALEDGVSLPLVFVVTPLNILGADNVERLEKAGIRAVNVTALNSNSETFKVCERTI